MTITAADLTGQIRGFVIENFLYGAAEDLPPNNQSLIEAEIIDSTGVVELVLHVEETYGFRIDEDDITPDNFDSVDRIVAFILAHQGAPGT